MSTHVLRLPQAIWARCGLRSEVACVGETVREILDDACRRMPELATYVAPGTNSLPRSVIVFADGVRVRDIAADHLPTEAVLRLVIPAAGG